MKNVRHEMKMYARATCFVLVFATIVVLGAWSVMWIGTRYPLYLVAGLLLLTFVLSVRIVRKRMGD